MVMFGYLSSKASLSAVCKEGCCHVATVSVISSVVIAGSSSKSVSAPGPLSFEEQPTSNIIATNKAKYFFKFFIKCPFCYSPVIPALSTLSTKYLCKTKYVIKSGKILITVPAIETPSFHLLGVLIFNATGYNCS